MTISTTYTGQWYQAVYCDRNGAAQFFWHADRTEALLLALHHARSHYQDAHKRI